MSSVKPKIVYFHGYGSSPNSTKVNMMRDYGLDVHSWDINIDPSISIPFLEERIMDLLIDDISNDALKLVFVGTSLGAWYASDLGNAFGVESVLINPCYDPATMLKKYGIDDSILKKYDPIVFNASNTVYIGTKDEVIEFSGVNFEDATVRYVEGADHRFNDHFHHVLEMEFS